MFRITPRTYPRIAFETPIQYTSLPTNGHELHSTRSLNFSAGGLCYEGDQELEPSSEVCIVMENYSPGRFGPEGYRSYLARVCWIEPLSDPQEGLYATGAQIIARSHEILTTDVKEPRRICDICGVLMTAGRLRSTDENLQLCEHCYRYFQSIPQGKVRQCLTRFLLGNVV